MHLFLLIIHSLLALLIVGLVLVQRSDNDGFGLSGGGHGFLSGRAKANALTRATAVVAGLFMVSSLVLTIMVNDDRRSSVLDATPVLEDSQPATAEPTETKQQPAADDAADAAVPLAE
jgi:preprotein translocase subunit SecG